MTLAAKAPSAGTDMEAALTSKGRTSGQEKWRGFDNGDAGRIQKGEVGSADGHVAPPIPFALTVIQKLPAGARLGFAQASALQRQRAKRIHLPIVFMPPPTDRKGVLELAPLYLDDIER